MEKEGDNQPSRFEQHAKEIERADAPQGDVFIRHMEAIQGDHYSNDERKAVTHKNIDQGENYIHNTDYPGRRKRKMRPEPIVIVNPRLLPVSPECLREIEKEYAERKEEEV